MTDVDPTTPKTVNQSNSQETSKPLHEMTQEQLASVYFQGPKENRETKALPNPTVIRVVEKQRSYLLPWVITLIALIMASGALLSTKRIAIDIRVMDVETVVPGEEKFDARTTDNEIVQPLVASNEIASESVLLPEEPKNKMVPIQVSDFTFAGAAVLNSSRDRTILSLSNSSLSNLAYALINFDEPFSSRGYHLTFEVRGQRGGENVELIFKDVDNNSSLNQGKISPFEEGLSTQWRPVELEVQPSQFFNETQITQMRIEIGTQRTGNPEDAVIHFRNFQWIPILPNESNERPIASSDNLEIVPAI